MKSPEFIQLCCVRQLNISLTCKVKFFVAMDTFSIRFIIRLWSFTWTKIIIICRITNFKPCTALCWKTIQPNFFIFLKQNQTRKLHLMIQIPSVLWILYGIYYNVNKEKVSILAESLSFCNIIRVPKSNIVYVISIKM